MENLFAIDIRWMEVLYHFVNLVIAFVLVLPIGWHRGKAAQPVGLRTIPLVSMAAAGYVLLGRVVLAGDVQAQARLLQGLITGVGFVGGGVIVTKGAEIEGTSTAVSIWNTAAIGASVAYGRYEIALVLAGVNFILLLLMTPTAREMGEEPPPLVDEDAAVDYGEGEDEDDET